MKPPQSEVESSTVKGTFSAFLLPQKRAYLRCPICCYEIFSFCDTRLILTSTARAAGEAGHARRRTPAASLERSLQAGQGLSHGRTGITDAIPMAGDVCTGAKVPALSLGSRKPVPEQESHSDFTHPAAAACCRHPLLQKYAASQV